MTASDSGSINYLIRPGETLSQIASDHNYTDYSAEEIAAMNGISNPDLIYAGDTLRLPVPATSTQASNGRGQLVLQSYDANGNNGSSYVGRFWLPQEDESSETVKDTESTFESWLSKKDGTPLSDEEGKVQILIGSSEMALGFAGIFFSKGLAVKTGSYVMADGAIVVSKGVNNIKCTPFFHLANDFANPSSSVNNASMKFVNPLP